MLALVTSAATLPADVDKEDVKEAAGTFVERFARFGYAGKGVTYLLLATLATWTAVTGGNDAPGSKGTLAAIADGTWGCLLVVVVGVGLAGYALWKLYQMILDPDGCGTSWKAILKRLFLGGSGAIHAWLAYFAFWAAIDGGGRDDDAGSSAQAAARITFEVEGGWIVVLLIATGIAAFSMQQLWKAWQVDLTDQLPEHEMRPWLRTFTHAVARGGLAARGLAFGTVAVLVATAAWTTDDDDVGGLDLALDRLGDFGRPLLVVTAVGLGLYGVYMLIKGTHRRIEPEEAKVMNEEC